jgi:hypothetical protein
MAVFEVASLHIAQFKTNSQLGQLISSHLKIEPVDHKRQERGGGASYSHLLRKVRDTFLRIEPETIIS